MGRVLGARVLVKTVQPWTELDEVEKKGLIVAPDWVKKENTPLPTTGIVLAVGEEVWCAVCRTYAADHGRDSYCNNYQPAIKEGDMVMFPKFSGSDFTIEGEGDLRILEVKEILCTLIDREGDVLEIASNGEENSTD